MKNKQNRTGTAIQGTIDDQHATFLRYAQEYVPIKEAARIMGVSTRSVYAYIQTGKLLSVRVGSSICVSAASARACRRSSVGRPRSRVPIWRAPVAQNLQYMWTITARLRAEQWEQMAQRLEEIRAGRKHLLPGTVARFIVHDDVNPEVIQIVLVWRQAVMPPDEEREAAIASFQDDLAEIVDWETASRASGYVVMNT